MKKFLVFGLSISGLLALFAQDDLPANSVGKDGRFHTRHDMYLCLNFSFDPGPDIQHNAFLKGELVFFPEKNDNPACIPVTQKMIDRENKVLDAIVHQIPDIRNGESGTVDLRRK